MHILVINCHTRENSFCTSLASAYIRGATAAGYEVKTFKLSDWDLGKNLHYGHDIPFEPDSDILKVQELISWSDHMVYVYPTWWAGPPALMRLFFEMVFSPGFAFRYHKRLGKIVSWDKLLIGKSARLISTMDAPPWYYKLILGDPGGKIMKKGILGFCCVKPIKSIYFGSVKLSTAKQREEWLKAAYILGKKEK